MRSKTTAITVGSFSRWLQDAQPGSVCSYHTGLLGFDRESNWEADRLARIAMRSYYVGRIELVQQRLGPGVCDYLAIKRKHERPPRQRRIEL